MFFLALALNHIAELLHTNCAFDGMEWDPATLMASHRLYWLSEALR